MRKRTCIAMLLAGGQGSRMGILTQNMAKPAVPFGGKYRLIDFPLSNCANSGIEVVGVLTQYQPLELNAYLGTGAPWDLDRMDGGVFVLPPYMRGKGGEWYKGSANAVTQNIDFIEQYNPEFVAVLSGDHVYKMNYNRMLAFHREKGAACTVAALEVPWAEASRYGIMNTDDDHQIIEFDEKPKKPKSNKASMGVYIFTWEKLRAYLLADDEDKSSQNDFGKNVLPAMLSAGERMVAYPFQGYWKDVGTIDSFWEANMDLLQTPPAFELYDSSWRIYARNPVQPPHYIGPQATIHNSLVTEGCIVQGSVAQSVLFAGVRVERGAVVKDCVVMPNTVIRAGAKITRAIIAESAVLGENCRVGEESGKIAVVGDHVTVPAGMVVAPGEQLDGKLLAERLLSATAEAKVVLA